MNSNDKVIRKYYCPLDNRQCNGCAGDSNCGYKRKYVIEEDMEDCDRLYNTVEKANMFIAVPLLFFALVGTGYMLYYIVRLILWLY